MSDARDLLSSLPSLLLLILVAFLTWLVYQAWIGHIDDSFARLVSTVVLVVITLYYSWQSRKNAAYTKSTLTEMRKDRAKEGKILLIAFGIDPILDDLEHYALQLENRQDDFAQSLLPELPKVQTPGRVVVTDVDEHANGFRDKIEQFDEQVTSYRSQRNELISNIVTYATSDFIEINVDSGAERHNAELEVEMAVKGVLTGSTNDPNSEDVEDVEWDAFQDALQPVQDHAQFGSQIDEIIGYIDGLDQLIEGICDDLRRVRADLRDTYDITELEIKEVKQESELEEATVRDTTSLM